MSFCPQFNEPTRDVLGFRVGCQLPSCLCCNLFRSSLPFLLLFSPYVIDKAGPVCCHCCLPVWKLYIGGLFLINSIKSLDNLSSSIQVSCFFLFSCVWSTRISFSPALCISSPALHFSMSHWLAVPSLQEK